MSCIKGCYHPLASLSAFTSTHRILVWTGGPFRYNCCEENLCRVKLVFMSIMTKCGYLAVSIQVSYSSLNKVKKKISTSNYLHMGSCFPGEVVNEWIG